MTTYAWRPFGSAAGVINTMPAPEVRKLQRAVDEHEAVVADDCSDGPHVALLSERAELQTAMHACCGWHESLLTAGGIRFAIGSCHGH